VKTNRLKLEFLNEYISPRLERENLAIREVNAETFI